MFRLTPHEVEVLKWIAAGKTTKEIASILFRSPRTIDKHRWAIKEKLGIHTVAGLATFYKCYYCKITEGEKT